MNYVRKLGFEETPDYDFLRELFSKVMKTLGEPDDGIFDWMLLNSGKGWEAGNVCRQFPLINISLRGNICRPRHLCLHKLTPMLGHLIPHTAKGGTGKHSDAPLARYKIMSHHQHHTSLPLRLRTSKAAVDDPTHKTVQPREARLVCNRWLPIAAG
jgi:hypothetical protein